MENKAEPKVARNGAMPRRINPGDQLGYFRVEDFIGTCQKSYNEVLVTTEVIRHIGLFPR